LQARRDSIRTQAVKSEERSDEAIQIRNPRRKAPVAFLSSVLRRPLPPDSCAVLRIVAVQEYRDCPAGRTSMVRHGQRFAGFSLFAQFPVLACFLLFPLWFHRSFSQ
jgi:hypothetical protein